MVARRASKGALRCFKPGFLGYAKLKQAARGDVTHTPVGWTYRPKVPDCARALQPIVKFCASRTAFIFRERLEK